MAVRGRRPPWRPRSVIVSSDDFVTMDDTHDVLTVTTLDVVTVIAELGCRDPTTTVCAYWTMLSYDPSFQTTCMNCLLRLWESGKRRSHEEQIEAVTKEVSANRINIVSFDDMPDSFQCPRCRASLVTRNPEWLREFGPL